MSSLDILGNESPGCNKGNEQPGYMGSCTLKDQCGVFSEVLAGLGHSRSLFGTSASLPCVGSAGMQISLSQMYGMDLCLEEVEAALDSHS